ncbi:hypothetical protein JW868_00630 [Candidatus Woesearchaeota archaeon]|nr:hypothetical protein [Candidatus Woesearchaeota archaeon]
MKKDEIERMNDLIKELRKYRSKPREEEVVLDIMDFRDGPAPISSNNTNSGFSQKRLSAYT